VATKLGIAAAIALAAASAIPGSGGSGLAAGPPGADLGLAKTVSNPAPNVGDTITFTVTLSNAGPAVATSVQVSDLLPAGLSFVSATPSQGTYASGSGLWTVGTVTTTTPQTLQLSAVVVSPKRQRNEARILNADQADPAGGNNKARATETPQQADLGLKKTVSNRAPNVGDTITFTVTLTNKGPDSATTVGVFDQLPAGLTFVSATPSQGAYSPGSGMWSVGTVTKTVPQTLQLTATVVSPGARTNTAVISDSDQFDKKTGNNVAEATETPQQAELGLVKTVDNTTPSVGQRVRFTVALTNAGPDPATSVEVSDLLPAGMVFVSASPSQGSYNPGSGVWTVGTMKNKTVLLRIDATVVSPGLHTNTAAISGADQFDPNTLNNAASASLVA
jgi:uncharacterized repeat protein (TIGR01451 family)